MPSGQNDGRGGPRVRGNINGRLRPPICDIHPAGCSICPFRARYIFDTICLRTRRDVYHIECPWAYIEFAKQIYRRASPYIDNPRLHRSREGMGEVAFCPLGKITEGAAAGPWNRLASTVSPSCHPDRAKRAEGSGNGASCARDFSTQSLRSLGRNDKGNPCLHRCTAKMA